MCANLCTRDHPSDPIRSHPIELRPGRSDALSDVEAVPAMRYEAVPCSGNMRWRQMHSTVRACHAIRCTVHSACEATADGPLLVHVGGERADRRRHAHRDDPHRHHLCVASSRRGCNAKHTLHATRMHVRARMRACVHAHVCFRVSVFARARACVRICTRATAYSADPCVAAVTFVAAVVAEMQKRRRSRLHARGPSEKYRMRAQITRCCDRSRFHNGS